MAALRPTSALTAHPKLGPGGVLPGLTEDEYAGLRESIRADGIMQPIVVAMPDMVVLDGHHRWLAAKELGLEQVPVMLQDFGDDAAHLRLGLSLNFDRRHMTGEQKRAAAAALLKEDPTQSDRSVAAAVGVSPTTVGSVRADLEDAGDVSKLDTRTDSAGREQPARKPRSTGSIVGRKGKPRPRAVEVKSSGADAGAESVVTAPEIAEVPPVDEQAAPTAEAEAGPRVQPPVSDEREQADGGVVTSPSEASEDTADTDPGVVQDRDDPAPRASSAEPEWVSHAVLVVRNTASVLADANVDAIAGRFGADDLPGLDAAYRAMGKLVLKVRARLEVSDAA